MKERALKYLFSTILISTSIFLLFNSTIDLFKKNIQFPQKISHFAFSVLILSILILAVVLYYVILAFRIVGRTIDKGCDWLDL